MKWRTTLLVIVMFAMAMPAMAQKPQLPIERLSRYVSDVAPYDRITGYCFNPNRDWNKDGIINTEDCFVEFHHVQSVLVIVRVGMVHNWQSGSAYYQELQIEVCRQGYNRFYSPEFYQTNSLINSITIKGYIYYDYETIDNLDYESLDQSQYPIVEYQ